MALAKEIFKENGFQFVGRYIYDSGEVSAIGPISSMIKAQEASSGNAHLLSPASYTITIGSSHPTYATYLDIYARAGNDGIWRRCKTIDLANPVTQFDFSGELFEALESEESTKLFDAVPLETRTIEVANNRVFLGNNKDDFDNSPSGMMLTVNDSSSDTLTNTVSAGDPISYFNYTDDLTNGVSGFSNSPFANASQYKIGFAFFDEYLRTRGVEISADFETGEFTYPIYPSITLTRTGTMPIWARYYQVMITKNLTKDFTYEGYASNYYWEIKNASNSDVRYIKDEYRGDILYLVLDISGMIQAGYSYVYQEGDRINLNITTSNATKVIKNMKITGQSSNLIYIEYSKDEGFESSAYGNTSTAGTPTIGDTVDIWRMFFEIYSPRSIEDVQLFYETGTLRSIEDFNSLGDTVTIDVSSATRLDGDTVFHNVAVKSYSITTVDTGDNLHEQTLDTDTNVLIRKVNGTTRNSDWDRNIGKVLPEYDGQSRQRSNSKIKYGGKYIQGTNINPISSFSFIQEAEVPYENGAITSLKRASKVESDGDVMLAICERETATLYIGEAVLTGTTGDGFVSTTQSVIGTVRNLKGGFGTSNKRSVVAYQGNVYWWDGNKKKVIRYGRDGMTPISDYFMKSYFLGKSGDCLGFYDPYYNSYHIKFDSDNYSTAFSEARDRWISHYDITAASAETRGDKFLLLDTLSSNLRYSESLIDSAYSTIFGVSKDAYITYTMNTQLPEIMKNVKLYSDMNIYDYNQPNNVKADLFRMDITNENGQATQLIESNYLAEDNVLFAHVLRDSNSTEGIIDGGYVVGSLTDIKITLRNNEIQTRLNNVIVETDLSTGHLS
jgi:hypothetical protein